MKRDAVLDPQFLADLRYWTSTDWRAALRLLDLVADTMRSPFDGIGKPEPLKHTDPNTWSRRLSHSDRIVHRVLADRIVFLQARGHY